jgi:HD-GYP domain-containing protein (c-di-GMP phosphodiesterase class II)
MAMYQYQKNALLEIEYTDRLNEEVKQQTAVAEKRSQKIEEMSFQTIQTLAEAIDAKDPYTNGHSTRVSHYSVLLAKELGWNKDQLRDLRYAAMVHDIGKIGIPDAILCRPTGLNDVEYDIVKSHTTMGYNILKDRTQVKMAEDVALYHHERYDGTGYPKGLKNVEIPDAARIVAIADAFDAMNSNRIYRKTCDETHIRNELVTGAGKQFDPVFVMAFVKLWDNGIITLDEFENEGLKNQTIKIESFLLRDNIRKFISYNHTDSFDLGKDEIPRLMESISSIEKCFSYSVKTVQIELELQQAVEFNEKELEKAMIHLEDAIDQSLRKTDIAVRYNHQSYIIVLVETISIDVQSYIGRIFREFFKINGGIWFIPTCQILSQNTEEPDTN